jgi:hypothetical protein
MKTRNIRNLFRKTKEQSTFTESEAQYAAIAQKEISDATQALLTVIHRGVCTDGLAKLISKTAGALQEESEINHRVITNFLNKIEKI